MVRGWAMEFLIRQLSIPDPTLNRLLTRLLLLHNNNNNNNNNNIIINPSFYLYKSLLLRRLLSETSLSLSVDVLDLLELIEELHHVSGVPVTSSITTAYRLVADEFGVWSERVGSMCGFACGLVTEVDRESWRLKVAIGDERGRERRIEVNRPNGERIENEEEDAIGEERDKDSIREYRERGDDGEEDGIGEERGREKRREERRENGEKDEMGAVRAYVAEAYEERGREKPIEERRESKKPREREEKRENGEERGREKRREDKGESGEEEDEMGAVRAYVAEACEERGREKPIEERRECKKPREREEKDAMAAVRAYVAEQCEVRGRENPRESKKRRGNGEKDAMRAVRDYVAEAWEELGPSFLEVVAGVFGVVELESEGLTKEVVRSENNQVLHQHSMNNDGNNVSQLPTRKLVAKKFARGAKITETEQIKNRDVLKRYDCVSTPACDKLQAALITSSLELHAVVKDPLPEALQFAGRVISSNEKDNMAPKNNVSKPSIMLRNSTACTDEWGDSVENFPEGDSDIRRSRIKLPPPKNIVVSPLKKHVMKNFVGRRTIKKWSVIEEATLRTGVEKYGNGCWKTILNSYPDIFNDRTDCDLKDKWRNMTRYSH